MEIVYFCVYKEIRLILDNIKEHVFTHHVKVRNELRNISARNWEREYISTKTLLTAPMFVQFNDFVKI